MGPRRVVEQLPEPLKMVERKPARPAKANVMKRRPKLLERKERVSTKPREIDPTARPTVNNLTPGFGSRQTLKPVEQLSESMKVVERATSRSPEAKTTKRRPKLFERPEHVSTKSKEHNLRVTPPKNIKLELNNADKKLERPRQRKEGHRQTRRPKLLKTTTESPEAWLDRFADETKLNI